MQKPSVNELPTNVIKARLVRDMVINTLYNFFLDSLFGGNKETVWREGAYSVLIGEVILSISYKLRGHYFI